MTLNRHHGLRFDVFGVAQTAILYHWLNCDKQFIYTQSTIKFYSDIQKMILRPNNNDIYIGSLAKVIK